MTFMKQVKVWSMGETYAYSNLHKLMRKLYSIVTEPNVAILDPIMTASLAR